MLILFFMLVAAVPGVFVLYGLKRTLRRFQITSSSVSSAAVQSNQPYLDRARAVFAEHPEAAVYLFGHTHDAFVEIELDGRVVANLGTWLEILHRVPVRFGFSWRSTTRPCGSTSSASTPRTSASSSPMSRSRKSRSRS